MLAWRDMNHPLKGGAEIVTDKYLSGLSKKGHNVTLFSERFKGSNSKQSYNNYKIIRKGNKISVYVKGLLHAFCNREKYDIIIDQVNTIPFFTPLLIPKSKRKAFFHQLCREIWFYEKPFPISIIGYLMEWFYLKLYCNTQCFVVSDSTKGDLLKYAWCKPRNVLVLDNQIDFKPINKVKKKENAFCFCGRLIKSKRIDHCIRAISLVENSKLYIIGDGKTSYKQYLKRLSRKLELGKRVIFTGRINNEKRNKIMQKCLAILVTSVREGWGLIVTEANANGTIAITYDVPGLRDANKTGMVTRKKTPQQLAYFMKKLINDKILLQKKSKDSLQKARKYFGWDDNVEEMEGWILRN